jgi:hypothetical protein
MKVGLWNILADGLSEGEFLTARGKLDTMWICRRERIVEILKNMILSGVDIIATIENDHPLWILNEIREEFPEWRAVIVFRTHEGKIQKSVCRIRKEARQDNYSSTFFGESSEKIGELYEFSPSDRYVCDDTLTVYYDSSKYVLEEFLSDSFTKMFDSKPSESTFLFTERRFAQLFFRKTETDERFNVVIAHLPSGDDEEKEKLRVRILNQILDLCTENSIVLMDSNSSVDHPSDFPHASFTETIYSRDFHPLLMWSECFKLRHSHGDQTSKYGRFIFDTIDRVIIHRSKHFQEIPFVMPLTQKQEYLANRISCNDRSREIIERLCREKWGETTDTIDFEELSNLLNPIGKVHSSPEELKELFESMYPNQHLPSDHPPIMVEVYL